MSTTVTGPFTQSQNATTGVVPTFVASDRLQLAIMDMLRVDAFMGPPSMDFAGMGTDTKRDGDLNGVGFATTMSASGGEVTAPSASSYVVDYATRSIGEYNLAYTASLQSEVLAMPGRQLTLDDIIPYIPATYYATLRSLFVTAGGGISYITVGSTSTTASADDMFDLAAQISLRPGVEALGTFRLFIDPAQRNSLRSSFRSEPAFVQNMVAFQRAVAVGGMVETDPFGLGFDTALTDDIVQASSAYKAFCVPPGALRWSVADPSRARIPAGARPMFVPGLGLVMYELLGTLDAKKLGVQAVAFMGVNRANTTVSHQILYRSLV